jgi:hypothetical protein
MSKQNLRSENDDIKREERDVHSHENYQTNKENYIQQALAFDGKHGFLPQALHGHVRSEQLLEHCDIVTRHAHKSDFSIIILIRLLYFQKNPEIDRHRHQIELALQNFSFWTGDTELDSRRTAMEQTIFWSENHIFMYLSTAYLFHQYLSSSSSSSAATDHTPTFDSFATASSSSSTTTTPSCSLSHCCVKPHDGHQLLIYLEAHCHQQFSGVYEVLSCTYLPWTICALLNLYDFAHAPRIQELSKQLLDEIISLFCLVSTNRGICNLTACTRQYPDLRTRTWGHNINQLLTLVTGCVHDPIGGLKPSQLGDFLVTSEYQPPADIIEKSFEFHGSIEKRRMNHLTKETREIFQNTPSARLVDPIELVPFYW